eukprot:CAMPEP_0176038096 /NCGR_PEP_ID=MMETSP0120_2-20121206/18877_1 /TAXON_ID=160619 /ORGANISM="Kryptoperidinium foliaceum, Strain CCMP 1326" /LENGTH=711 /DNA_ID=CAMNT_0017371487 /DNA_START=60 /DNA_END=2195 /DNA_ORIENTATION=-
MASARAATAALVALFSRSVGAAAVGSARARSTAVLQRDAEVSLKERPVMKVVRLLQDMQAELQKELDDDKAVYEQLHCWCKQNDQEKSHAIDMGTQQVEQLKSSLSEASAKLMELKSKRKDTWDELQSDKKALQSAKELRMKENKAFHAEETDLLEAVQACKQAIVVLSKHNPSMAQVQAVAKSLQSARVQELALASGSAVGRLGSQVVREFVQGAAAGSASAFLGVPGFQSYAPQSGQIFGILQQMQTDFEASLSETQKAELKAQEQFEQLRAAKADEIASGEKQIVDIDAEMADLGEKVAQETKALEDTQEQLALDTEFLANLRRKCQMTEEEFAARTKSRMEEIAAVEETIHILNSDTAFDNFDKTVSTASFLQIGSRRGAAERSAERQARAGAAAVLRAAAKRVGLPALALLASSAQIDAFAKVKEEIDKMVVQLTKQQSDEVEHRDWCIKEMNDNNRSTEAGYDKQESLETKMANLEQELKENVAKTEETKASIAEMQKQMKRASEIREAENSDYQLTVGDHQMTQVILKKAIDRMKQVYALVQQDGDDQPGAPHIQTSGNHTDPGNGPARFTEYEQHAGGSRVVSMLEKVLADSQKMEDEAHASEQDSQSAYESFMKDSNKSIKQGGATLVSLAQAKAAAEASLSMAKEDHKATMTELEGLNSALGDLRQSCNFLLKNFGARQEARQAEMDALREAKAILSGMSS